MFKNDFICQPKTSRLAVLGDLGRYPLFIKSMSQCINYKMSLLGPGPHSSLLTDTVREMQTMHSAGVDCWLTRVNKMQSLLNISDRRNYKKTSNKTTTAALKSKFDRYWLDCVNLTKTNTQDPTDKSDHNKLRMYRTLKSSFTREPYIDLVRNRNQKSFISRLRTGSHFLQVERGRWTRPVTPLHLRACVYCAPPSTPATPPCTGPPVPGPVDDEQHFLVTCNRFEGVRKSAFEELSTLLPTFDSLSESQQFSTLLCPTQPQTAKVANRLIKKMFELREKIDNATNNSDSDLIEPSNP